MIVVVDIEHTWYGCETGCCGHEVTRRDTCTAKFFFEHPYGRNDREFSADLVRKAWPELVDFELGSEDVRDD